MKPVSTTSLSTIAPSATSPSGRLPRFSTAMAAGMSEATLQANVLQTAKDLGWLAYHTFDSRRSPAGFPDLVLVHDQQRRCIFTELKTERGRQSPAQRDWEHHLRAAGCEFYLWRPTQWLEGTVVRILQARAS
jgi:hypothetical protein